MHTPKASETSALELGLGSLTCFSEMGDHIGMESCVDLNHNEEVMGTEKTDYTVDNSQRWGAGKRNRRSEMRREKKEYPPPIPLLARTGNLQSHMPWVMKRYYTSDGRLIIKEEKVEHHEYFRAHRANGRLTLQLVPLDHDVLAGSHIVGQDENATEVLEEETEDGNDDIDDARDVGDDNVVRTGTGTGTGTGTKTETEAEAIYSDQTVLLEEAAVIKLPESSMEIDGMGVLGGGGGKCYKYNTVRLSSCMFGMPVPAIRPVRI